MNLSRKDIIQSALDVKIWCEKHMNEPCDCPFSLGYMCLLNYPMMWNFKKLNINRGTKNGD